MACTIVFNALKITALHVHTGTMSTIKSEQQARVENLGFQVFQLVSNKGLTKSCEPFELRT